jgi:hypothetical protein
MSTLWRMVVAFLVISVLTQARAGNDDAWFFDLSLEELAKVAVAVASDDTELIRETAAIVSSVDVAVMEAMGIHTIEDMLTMLPGFLIQESSIGNFNVERFLPARDHDLGVLLCSCLDFFRIQVDLWQRMLVPSQVSGSQLVRFRCNRKRDHPWNLLDETSFVIHWRTIWNVVHVE